jgi:hypothetical protein
VEQLYGGEAGWAHVLLKALRSVVTAVREELLPFGRYRESEVCFVAALHCLTLVFCC